MKVSQAEFARMMRVSRKTVTKWKGADRILMDGDLVDVERSRDRLLRYTSSSSKAYQGAVTLADKPEAQVTDRAVYADGAEYDEFTNLPPEVLTASVAIGSGASEMALLLARHRMPIPQVRQMVGEWVAVQRAGWVGGPGLPSPVSDCWPEAPIGFVDWYEHPLFLGDPLSPCDWAEIVAETAALPPLREAKGGQSDAR